MIGDWGLPLSKELGRPKLAKRVYTLHFGYIQCNSNYHLIYFRSDITYRLIYNLHKSFTLFRFEFKCVIW